jgi:uncharacterized protein
MSGQHRLMAKILLLAIIVWLLFLVIKRYVRNLHSGPAPGAPDSAVMVQCRHCGLHIPKDDSVIADGDYYCCEEHRQQSTPDV